MQGGSGQQVVEVEAQLAKDGAEPAAGCVLASIL